MEDKQALKQMQLLDNALQHSSEMQYHRYPTDEAHDHTKKYWEYHAEVDPIFICF